MIPVTICLIYWRDEKQCWSMDNESRAKPYLISGYEDTDALVSRTHNQHPNTHPTLDTAYLRAAHTRGSFSECYAQTVQRTRHHHQGQTQHLAASQGLRLGSYRYVWCEPGGVVLCFWCVCSECHVTPRFCNRGKGFSFCWSGIWLSCFFAVWENQLNSFECCVLTCYQLFRVIRVCGSHVVESFGSVALFSKHTTKMIIIH